MAPALEVVGRESEMGSVSAFLDAAAAHPAALLVEGELGIGKTTLWQAGVAAAAERGCRVLACRAVEAEIALPFTALGDLLEELPEDALARLATWEPRGCGERRTA